MFGGFIKTLLRLAHGQIFPCQKFTFITSLVLWINASKNSVPTLPPREKLFFPSQQGIQGRYSLVREFSFSFARMWRERKLDPIEINVFQLDDGSRPLPPDLPDNFQPGVSRDENGKLITISPRYDFGEIPPRFARLRRSLAFSGVHVRAAQGISRRETDLLRPGEVTASRFRWAKNARPKKHQMPRLKSMWTRTRPPRRC